MNTWLRVLTVLLAASILQSSILGEIRIGGVGAELLLLIAVLSSYFGTPIRGMIISFLAGLTHDCLVASPLGLHALVYLLVSITVSNLEERLFGESRLVRSVGIFLGVATGIFGAAIIGYIFGQSTFEETSLGETILISGLLTTVMARPVSVVVKWAIFTDLRSEIVAQNRAR